MPPWETSRLASWCVQLSLPLCRARVHCSHFANFGRVSLRCLCVLILRACRSLQDIDGAPNPAMLLFGSRLMADDTKRLSDLEVFDDTCVMCVPGRRPAKGAAPKDAAPKDAGPKDAAPMEEQVPARAPAPAPAPAAGEAKAAAQPKGEGGGGAKHDAGAKEDDVDTMLPLQIKTLSGVSSSIEVPVHANFGHIKHKYIQPVTDIPAVQMRLIYLGQLVDDTKSPFEYNIFSGSFVHLVRR